MKNIKKLLALLVITSVFFSCQKEEDPGGVALGDMCGEWIYTVDSVAHGKLFTSNNAANDPNVMVISDQLGWKWFNIEVNANTTAKSFSVDTAINQEYENEARDATKPRTLPYDIKIVVSDGKITKGAVELPSGLKADKIEFKIGFEKDTDGPYTVHQVIGYRRSGFLEDESFVYAEK